MSEKKLKIALQKSGRLHEDSIALLKNCGIRFGNGVAKLKAEARNFPLEIFFLRDDDIPEYVADGVADVGIVGENVIYEAEKDVQIIEKLGFGRCRLSIAVPKSFNYQNFKNLEGNKIATTYPNILKKFIKENNLQVEIHNISGSVEIAPSIGLADAICDLVSSGGTLFSNGLREVEVVMQSEAALISKKNLAEDSQRLLDKILFRVKAVIAAKQNKYILLNAPNDKLGQIIKLLPGMKSPTVLPLAETGWSSVHSVINENDFWEIVEQLKVAGAEGILVVSIDQMIK
jgi:ATP phosphoribosyltransferase